MNGHNSKKNWKRRLDRWFFNLHQEIIKTSAIGKKMLTASRTSAHLRETYEELGKLVEKSIEDGELDWNSPKAKMLLTTIKACKFDLEEIEKQVNKIRFSSIEVLQLPEETHNSQTKIKTDKDKN